uniref:SEC23-interacting protein n=1 Tax=Anthurium amnicola TaxID=1678845 RepID=A0A1D1XJZ2_9ARAE
MYADQVATGKKRSVKERLNGNLEVYSGRGSTTTAGVKRQRQDDDKWKHDLYEDNEEPQASKARVGDKDLRLKLQKKSSQQFHQGGKSSGVRDLREKLSGTMHLQPVNTDPPKAKATTEVARTTKKSVASVEPPAPETKKAANSVPSKKKPQPKSVASVDSLLCSLGLEKYLITFQAEEVDMTALLHMTDEDLKALGIPMGPRKKILLALDSRK